MILLLGLICSIWGEPAHCLQEDTGFSFEGDLRLLTVDISSVLIGTDEKLYQLNHDLTLIHSLTQRGILKSTDHENMEEFYRDSMNAAWNTTFSVNVLLPYVNNNTLISCGVFGHKLCSYCEVLDLKNISKLVYREHIHLGPLRSSSSGSVSFLVDVKKDSGQTETYILTAIRKQRDEKEERKCSYDDVDTVNLHNTDERQMGGIFSRTDSSASPSITAEADVEFVDGFQISSTVYLFSNVASGAKTNKVRLIWLQAETSKTETLKSLCGATLSSPDGGDSSRLLASSVISGGQQVQWSGVFSMDGGETNTQLLLFDISPDQSREKNTDPDFYYTTKSNNPTEPVVLKPKAVIFKLNNMSSVLVTKLNGWMVFFIGTTDGQLIKLAVDRKYQPACPEILYRTSGDNKVFPKIQLDPVNQKHVYVPFKNQVQRVPVSKCRTHQNVKDCVSAQDPFCVWCVSKRSCTFKADCTDSEWFSIPEESGQKIISHKVLKDSTGEVEIVLQSHLTMKQMVQNFACLFSTSSTQLCKIHGPRPQYPQCTCIINGLIPADDVDVNVRIRLGDIDLTQNIKVINCSNLNGKPSFHLCQRCITAGCGWSQNSCSWARDPIQNDVICSNIETFGMKFPKPEISSINPSVLSFYGRNRAVLSGRNLRDVTRVRIKGNLDCDPKESPVWNNNGTSLTFHIPRTETKGVVKVCVLLPDGSCHGKFTITYQSAPICSNIAPSSSWRSGKRNITLLGTHLDLVEGITHSHAQQEVIPARNSNYWNLTYETLRAEIFQVSSVYLNLANETLECSKKITYCPDPEFTSFTAVAVGEDVRIIIQKKADNLEMTTAELSVLAVQNEKEYSCIVQSKENSANIETFICEIRGLQNADFKEVKIHYGEAIMNLQTVPSSAHTVPLILGLILWIIAVLVTIVLWKKRGRSAERDQL